jgi:hypothetical protein
MDYYVIGYTERVPIVRTGIAGALTAPGRRVAGGSAHAVNVRNVTTTVCGESVPRGGLRRELTWTRYELDACSACRGVVTVSPVA